MLLGKAANGQGTANTHGAPLAPPRAIFILHHDSNEPSWRCELAVRSAGRVSLGTATHRILAKATATDTDPAGFRTTSTGAGFLAT